MSREMIKFCREHLISKSAPQYANPSQIININQLLSRYKPIMDFEEESESEEEVANAAESSHMHQRTTFSQPRRRTYSRPRRTTFSPPQTTKFSQPQIATLSQLSAMAVPVEPFSAGLKSFADMMKRSSVTRVNRNMEEVNAVTDKPEDPFEPPEFWTTFIAQCCSLLPLPSKRGPFAIQVEAQCDRLSTFESLLDDFLHLINADDFSMFRC